MTRPLVLAPLVLATAALCLGGMVASGPAHAQNSGSTSKTRQLIAGATQTANDMKADPRFENLVKRARGIFIVPTMDKGGLLIGGKGGQGVLLVKHDDQWSDPAFISIGAISIGAEAGGSVGQTAMLLMTKKAVYDFSQANNFSVGANAGLTIVNYSAKGQAPIGKGDIVVWSNKSGAFAGADVSATDLTSNPQEDAHFYGHHVSTRQILQGNVPSKPAASKLEQALPT